MDNLIFGDESIFSINVSIKNQLVNASIFCAIDEIGDRNKFALLDTFATLLHNKIENYDYSLASKLINLDAAYIFSYITTGYENSENWRDSQKISSVWLTLDLSPSFDGDVFLLLSTPEVDRIIWKKLNSSKIKESSTSSGYILKQINRLLHSLPHEIQAGKYV